MIAIDTNILLRALVNMDDEPFQEAAARALVESAEVVRVASIVVVETVWVIQSRVNHSRADAVRVCRKALAHPRLQIERCELFHEAVKVFEVATIGFVDAVALVDARLAQCPLYTFDRKLARMVGARLMHLH